MIKETLKSTEKRMTVFTGVPESQLRIFDNDPNASLMFRVDSCAEYPLGWFHVSEFKSNPEFAKLGDFLSRDDGWIEIIESRKYVNPVGRIALTKACKKTPENIFRYGNASHGKLFPFERRPSYAFTSIGPTRLQVDNTGYLPTYESILEFIREQVAIGYRGWGLITVDSPVPQSSGGSAYGKQFIAEVQAECDSLTITKSTFQL